MHVHRNDTYSYYRHQQQQIDMAKHAHKSSKSVRKECISQMRRKRFFILVKILLKRLERDDPEGFMRAKEVRSLRCHFLPQLSQTS